MTDTTNTTPLISDTAAISINGACIKSVLDTKDYLDELNEALTEIEYIGIWVDDIEYSDFEKVLINVD